MSFDTLAARIASLGSLRVDVSAYQESRLHHAFFLLLWQFDALLENALQMGAEKLATGHYARLWRPQSGGPVQLLRGIDENKDQSYFLASVVWS